MFSIWNCAHAMPQKHDLKQFLERVCMISTCLYDQYVTTDMRLLHEPSAPSVLKVRILVRKPLTMRQDSDKPLCAGLAL